MVLEHSRQIDGRHARENSPCTGADIGRVRLASIAFGCWQKHRQPGRRGSVELRGICSEVVPRRGLSAKDIHAPWEKGIQAQGYPARPIIERNKERTLAAYNQSKFESQKSS